MFTGLRLPAMHSGVSCIGTTIAVVLYCSVSRPSHRC